MSIALVIGASGGIGAALTERLRLSDLYSEVLAFSRCSDPAIDLTDEESISQLALCLQGKEISLIINASGILSFEAEGQMLRPERSLKQIDAEYMRRIFEVNTIGPALLIKHLAPLLPRDSESRFVHLSARVGSISDNNLGGWHSYRASKAALNQIIRTSSIELKRTHPKAIIAALHPGTVETSLSNGFIKQGLDVQQPAQAAERLVSVIESLKPEDSGGFFDHKGKTIAW